MTTTAVSKDTVEYAGYLCVYYVVGCRLSHTPVFCSHRLRFAGGFKTLHPYTPAMKERVKRGSKAAYKRGRRGIVIFITSDKVIQSVLTGAVTGFIFSLNEGVAAYFRLLLKPYVPFYVPVKLYAAVGAVLLFMAAYWADRNTDEWRAYVREATGEDTAEDSASDEDLAGDSK